MKKVDLTSEFVYQLWLNYSGVDHDTNIRFMKSKRTKLRKMLLSYHTVVNTNVIIHYPDSNLTFKR